MRLLTDEQLRRVDEIITDEINLEIDYVFNGEDSLPEIDGDETLRNAARAVRAYLETLETEIGK
jgi:hypothetical protein